MHPQPKAEPAKPKRRAPCRSESITNAEELACKLFRDSGEVSGDSCQASQSGPSAEHRPHVADANQRLQNESQCGITA
ncbi:Rcs stress response system protein RcsF [Shigella flexneri]